MATSKKMPLERLLAGMTQPFPAPPWPQHLRRYRHKAAKLTRLSIDRATNAIPYECCNYETLSRSEFRYHAAHLQAQDMFWIRQVFCSLICAYCAVVTSFIFFLWEPLLMPAALRNFMLAGLRGTHPSIQGQLVEGIAIASLAISMAEILYASRICFSRDLLVSSAKSTPVCMLRSLCWASFLSLAPILLPLSMAKASTAFPPAMWNSLIRAPISYDLIRVVSVIVFSVSAWTLVAIFLGTRINRSMLSRLLLACPIPSVAHALLSCILLASCTRFSGISLMARCQINHYLEIAALGMEGGISESLKVGDSRTAIQLRKEMRGKADGLRDLKMWVSTPRQDTVDYLRDRLTGTLNSVLRGSFGEIQGGNKHVRRYFDYFSLIQSILSILAIVGISLITTFALGTAWNLSGSEKVSLLSFLTPFLSTLLISMLLPGLSSKIATLK